MTTVLIVALIATVGVVVWLVFALMDSHEAIVRFRTQAADASAGRVLSDDKAMRLELVVERLKHELEDMANHVEACSQPDILRARLRGLLRGAEASATAEAELFGKPPTPGAGDPPSGPRGGLPK